MVFQSAVFDLRRGARMHLSIPTIVGDGQRLFLRHRKAGNGTCCLDERSHGPRFVIEIEQCLIPKGPVRGQRPHTKPGNRLCGRRQAVNFFESRFIIRAKARLGAGGMSRPVVIGGGSGGCEDAPRRESLQYVVLPYQTAVAVLE
jgi:hypothetical protein